MERTIRGGPRRSIRTGRARRTFGCGDQLQYRLSESDAPIWGNGSDFDNAILQHAFRQHGLRWPYWRNRCLRSLRGVVLDLYPQCANETPPFEGLKHHSMDDARHEARQLVVFLDILNRHF
ncbi:3'-5' exoribonuclease domain-containing protein [Paludibacterium denitrificans]|uniref:3'-5' exoribonuclease domain-containing protein n=1 Tax=Paludibacterium denitrificans TaxID=2675226 RepID=UPI0035E42F44